MKKRSAWVAGAWFYLSHLSPDKLTGWKISKDIEELNELIDIDRTLYSEDRTFLLWNIHRNW